MAMPATRYRFTVDEYFRMGDVGIFHEDDRVELLDGEIVEMTPIGPRHAGCVKNVARLLYAACGDTVILGVQDPLIVSEHAAPEPDVAVLRTRPDHYSARHPGPEDTLLVIEVADSSVDDDRSLKLPLYAQAGILESWLVNLPDDVIEVYREPREGLYTVRQLVRRGETLTPLNLPALELAASEILGA